jgi:hypothetical protein
MGKFHQFFFFKPHNIGYNWKMLGEDKKILGGIFPLGDKIIAMPILQSIFLEKFLQSCQSF